jgi:CheY-like chemotaxis protein
MDEASGSGHDQTDFAKPGRATLEQLTAQMSQSLDDPCIKVVLEAVTGFVMILNENRQILAANRELLEALERHDSGCIVGLRPGEAFNCVHFTEGTDGCGTSKHCRTCGAVLAILAAQMSGVPTTGECRLALYRDGKLEAGDFRVRVTPLTIGGCTLTAFVLHDISALKRREVLEQVFLHDFLNALGGIVGWTELMKDADQHTAAREIAALAESLKEEVVAQRTLLAAERGELVANCREFDVTELMATVELIFGRHPSASGKMLSIALLPGKTQIVSDRVLLLRVLVNALKNAFEASAVGDTVRLWFEWREDTPTFVVQNAGVMPEDVQARVFERSFSTRSEEGRGIGTYGMKLFGERYLGGKISFTSDQDNGTRFFVFLPSWKPSERIPGGSSNVLTPHTANGKHVLLVDDDEALLRLGELLLVRLGYRVTGCRSGAAALAAFGDAPDSFDAVITDWAMPQMSGEELAQRLSEVRPEIPILVCTGMGESAVPNPAGLKIHSVLGKPFTFQSLAEALDRAISGARSDS